MKASLALLALTLAGLASVPPRTALAQAPFSVNQVTVVGRGCPRGSFAVLALNDPDTQALSVLFSALAVEGKAPVVMGNGRDRVAPVATGCQILADITPRPGAQIALVNVRTSGFVDVFGPRDTDIGLNNIVRIERRYFFNTLAGDSRPREFLERATRIVESSGPYTIGDDAMPILSFAGCNARVRARIALRLAVHGELNYGDIGAIDQNSTVQFAFRARRCTGNEPSREPTVGPVRLAPPSNLRNVCVLEGDEPTGQRMKVCYDSLGNVSSREIDPDV